MSKDAFKWLKIESDRHKSRLSLYKPFPKYHNIFQYSALASPYFIFIKKSAVNFKLVDSFRLNSICHGYLIETNGNVSVPIVGFHMTSLKFKLKNYRSYRDFIFTMH